MEDLQIVDLYWQRDQLAIEHTQKKYGRYLAKVAYQILYDLEDCAESVNDTYMAAWNAIPPHRPQSLCAFLSRVHSVTKKALKSLHFPTKYAIITARE